MSKSWIKSMGYDDINQTLYINGKPYCYMPEGVFKSWSNINEVFDWNKAKKMKSLKKKEDKE